MKIGLDKILVMAAFLAGVNSSAALGCSDVSAADGIQPPVVFAQQEGAGPDPVAMRVEYTVEEKLNAAQRPLSLFIDVSGAKHTGDWRKIGPLIPFGPASKDNVKRVTVAIPAELKNDIKDGSSSFAVALSADDNPSFTSPTEGLSLKSATVIRD